ncbi:error-prone DNA polymerase [Afifella pfennigii]|uniref:error-prone DNA polymerase n=1 Tax=Afifella pfennigii TaxID=209897 RepID=UPI00047C4EED|nr:error-prone DNA polymerase [Afifella pfennigii]
MRSAPPYAELQAVSNYSFLRGASHPEELFAEAANLGLSALAITDHGSLAGLVRAHAAARETGLRLIVGTRLKLLDGPELLLYPRDRAAYGRLCRLLTLGKTRAGKGGCKVTRQEVAAHGEGQMAILIPEAADEALAERLAWLKESFGNDASLALTLRRRPGEALRLAQLAAMAGTYGVPAVATGDVLYHRPERRILQDVMTAIREGVTLDELGFRREAFADRHLKSPEEMARLFSSHPQALLRSAEIADACRFTLEELKYQYPSEILIPGMTPQAALEKLTWEGAAERFPGGVPEKVATQLRHELCLVAELGYAPYFLTVNAIVRFARSEGILCQGRGSAANSAICFVLGITAIDPARNDLLFERFVSRDRGEPPDIDVDFEHERREEVIQWVYETYGRQRAALCATVVRYHAKGAIREVGKALGLTEDVTAALSSQIWGWSRDGVEEKHLAELNLNEADYRLRLTLKLSRALIGFPRHLSQHPGGFVLTEDRLDTLVPIEPAAMTDRQVIEWDKDDIDELGFMKVDVLGLGMLGCLRRCFDLLKAHRGLDVDIATVPAEEKAVYAMIAKADTVGVFQIESRAQMAMAPRLKPQNLYDLTVQIAIVRPGPIQGEMVHPYLRRREGKEAVEYPTEEFRRVLGKTLGVPLFQEQAMALAVHCAGFTPSEADKLRRSMATFKFTGSVSTFRAKFIDGMLARGYGKDFAERAFTMIEGFGSYGFPESHAASFALIAYASSWVKRHHPDIFLAAILNSQPMGFYAPAQLVRDARAHGVEVLPVDVNFSRWDSVLERQEDGRDAVRLGLRLAKGLANRDGAALVAARHAPYRSLEEVHRRAGLAAAALERLAEADAFASLGLSRRKALWAIRGLADKPLPLFAAADAREARILPEATEPEVALAAMTAGREVAEDYQSLGLTLRQHPVFFLRAELERRRIRPTGIVSTWRDGAWIEIAGMVLVRQRPGSAKGVMFITIEDETGQANIIVWPALLERQRRIVLSAGMLSCRGRVQREGEVIHVVAQHLTDLSDLLRKVGEREAPFPVPPNRADEVKNGGNGPDPREMKALGLKPRDILIPDLRPVGGISVKARNFR